MPTKEYTRKFIESEAMPLDDINKECVREKSIRHGHPSTLHLWWARRPLAAARAVIWANIVDDPFDRPDLFPKSEQAQREADRLAGILKRLVVWENRNNPEVIKEATDAMKFYAVEHGMVASPLSGVRNDGCSAPLYIKGERPRHCERSEAISAYAGDKGLAEDVAYYGQWMKSRAQAELGALYPRITGADGTPRTVIAWLWTRTVRCPNPMCACEAPLAGSFVLSKKRRWARGNLGASSAVRSSSTATAFGKV